MQPGAAIEGTVVNQAGDPAINIVVEAQRYAYDATGRRLVTVQLARTDDRGRYRVHSLPPGEYLLTAGPDPLEQAARGATPVALGHTFYPGTGRPDEARPIPLSVGQTASGLDISLTRVPVVGLTGRVRQSSGQPVTDMMVRLQRVGGPVGEVRGFSVPAGDQFDFPNVPAGEYWLMGVVRPAPGAELEFGAIRITVADQPQPNLVVTTAKGASITGRVEVDGGNAAIPSGLQIVAYDSEYTFPSLPVGAAAQVPTELVDANGGFAFGSLFGPRLLQVEHLPATWAVKSIALDGTEITDVVTEFGAGDRPRTLRVVVTPRAASVRGRVEDSDGRALAGARVVVFSNDERHWRPRSRLVRVTESGPDGSVRDRRAHRRRVLDRRGIVSRRRIVDGRKRAARAAQRRVTGGPQRRRDDDGRHAASEVTMSIVVIALLVLLQVPPPGAQNPSAQVVKPTGRIAGRVTDAVSGKPIVDATVRLVRWEGGSGRPVAPGRTNEQGAFEFKELVGWLVPAHGCRGTLRRPRIRAEGAVGAGTSH